MIRLATWNVNGLRARLALIIHWLRAQRPDVAGFQEIKCTDDQFPHDALRAEGYHAVVHGQKGWNGVAVISRREPALSERGLPGQEALGSRFITADVGDLRFTSVYVPNGKSVDHEDFPRKLVWLDALASHLAGGGTHGGIRVVGGDFNICPAAIDSWNEDALRGSIFHTDDERARYRNLLEYGLKDLFRERCPDTSAFSWWDYRSGAFHRGQGLRIDLLLGDASIVPRIRSVSIDRDYRRKIDGMTPSDHAPVLLDIE